MKLKTISFFVISFLLANIILASGAIKVDALTVPLTAGKYEETNPNIKFSGNWIVNNDARHSARSTKYSVTSGNSIEFSFTGTGFKFISSPNLYRGIAKITVDGVSTNVDNYSATTLFQKVLFQKTNLTRGTHTVKIEVTPYKNAASKSIAISFDAIEILDTPIVPLTAGKYEETNPNIRFQGNWIVNNDGRHSASSTKYSVTSGNSIEFSFIGTGFKFISSPNLYRGIAKITVDGVSTNVDNYSATTLFQKVLFQKTNLTRGTHTVKIEVTPYKSAASKAIAISFDAIEILDTPIVPLTVGKYEETNPNIRFQGNWIVNNDGRHSASSTKYSVTSGNSIDFSFKGTGFKFISSPNLYRGISKITVDGVSSNVDNYSATTLFQRVLFEKNNLAPGTHTVKIEVTPYKNAASKAIAISFDAIEILDTPIVPLTVGKYEETNPNIRFQGNWIVNNDGRHSASSTKYSVTSGNSIDFSFTGTGFKFISSPNLYRGIAKITVDGISTNVDNYSATTLFQRVLFEKTNLAPGAHTVKIEVTPYKNAASKSIAISFDAVEILDTTINPEVPLEVISIE